MSTLEVTLRLAAVVVLAGYLYAKHRQRANSRERSGEATWRGQSIDAAKLKPMVENVRRNYIAAHPPARGICFHRALLALARRAIGRLEYFHDRASEAPARPDRV